MASRTAAENGAARAASWLPALAGSALIAMALLANEWTLARTLSPDGALGPRFRAMVWAFDASAASIGAALILLRGRIAVVTSRLLLRDYPNLGALAVGLGLVVVLVLALEGVFFGLNQAHRHRSPLWRVYSKGFDARHPLLGHRPEPGRVHAETLWRAREKIFGARYTIDEYTRRVVPSPDSDTPSRFILVCGGSFAFGTGAEDDQTLAYYLGAGASGYRAYNYGGMGHGIQQTLAILDQWDLKTQVAEKSGALVYVFIPQHIPRTIPTMWNVTSFGRYDPCFRFTSTGEAVYLGPFNRAHPVRTVVYDILHREQMMTYVGVDWPPAILSRHIEYTADMLLACARRFRAIFDSEEFYVLFHPLSEEARRGLGVSPELIKRIYREKGLRLLDYENLLGPDTAGLFYPLDEHPTPEVHRRVAGQVLQDLDLAPQTE